LTTIVCDRKSIASDLQYTASTGYKWKGRTKLYRFSAHPLTYEHSDFIIGIAGTADDAVSIAHFYSSPEDWVKGPPKVGPNINGIVLTEDKNVFMFTSKYTQWMGVADKHIAIGSGGEFALGALAAGKSLKEAIKIASNKDSYTGMGYMEMSF